MGKEKRLPRRVDVILTIESFFIAVTKDYSIKLHQSGQAHISQCLQTVILMNISIFYRKESMKFVNHSNIYRLIIIEISWIIFKLIARNINYRIIRCFQPCMRLTITFRIIIVMLSTNVICGYTIIQQILCKQVTGIPAASSWEVSKGKIVRKFSICTSHFDSMSKPSC